MRKPSKLISIDSPVPTNDSAEAMLLGKGSTDQDSENTPKLEQTGFQEEAPQMTQGAEELKSVQI